MLLLMATASFNQIQPILGTRDLAKAVRFYVDRLGFTLTFGDPSIPVNYVGLRRDQAEFHMQFQYEHEMGTTSNGIKLSRPAVSPRHGAPYSNV
jgi:catechol 2,3-dioxygenase-like lactoylglutathione lyase family enzyme